MKVGNIVVARTDVPARFKNLKPGTLWKVMAVRGFGNDRITVGDKNHPNGIQTRAQYFHVLSTMDVRELKKLEGTDLAVRINAIRAFGPATVADAPLGFKKASYDGKTAYVPFAIGVALSKANPTKTVQAQFARG